MNLLEHPSITRTLKTGYPNVVAQPECCGIDVFGDEILSGDEIAIDEGQQVIILKENLEKYLSERYEFTFKTEE